MENQIKRMTRCFECGDDLGPIEDAQSEILAWHDGNGPLQVNDWYFSGDPSNKGSFKISLTLSKNDNPRDEYDIGVSVAEIDLDLPRLISLINDLVGFLPRTLVYSDSKKEERNGKAD